MGLSQYFSQYSSIPNKSAEYIEKHLSGTEQWIVTEKVHGSNFSVITDGIGLVCAKRSSILGPDEKFFDYQKIIEKYEQCMKKTFVNVESQFPNIKVIQIFGEIFGGQYPGHVVPHKFVQKDIYYTPDIDFIVFDIKVINSNNENFYLQQSELHKFLVGLKVVPILAEGSFEDMMKISPIFQTLVPKLYNLDDVKDNFAEGIVIRLNAQGPSRKPIKIKNPKFDEVVRRKKVRPTITISSLRKKICTYSTENRFNNVMSKLGREAELKDVKIEMKNDIIKDFESDLTKEQQQLYDTCKDKLEKFIRMRVFNSQHIDDQYSAFVQ